MPAYSARKRSNQATDSASRWLVGSSSKSMSGLESSRRHKAIRRFSPPESVFTSASQGGRRSESAAISKVRSISQPPQASIASCSLPCSASRSFISSSVMGSANLSLMALKRCNSSIVSPMPSSTLPRTSLSELSRGSWGK